MGGFLFTPGGGAAAGSVLGPAGTVIGGALGTIGGLIRGGVPGGGTWEDYFRRYLGLQAPGTVAPTTQAPPEFDFAGANLQDTTIYDEPIPELGQLPIPILTPFPVDYQFPDFTPTFGMDVYGEPIEEPATQQEPQDEGPPDLTPLPIPPLAPWMYPTFPGYPDPDVYEADAGTPTFPITVIGVPWPTNNDPRVYEPPRTGQEPPPPPPVISTPPPPIETPIPGTPIPPPTFPGPPAAPTPPVEDPSKPKIPGIGDLGALLGAATKGGPTLNIGGINAPVVGGGVTNSLFPLPGLNRFDIPSLGAYILGRM